MKIIYLSLVALLVAGCITSAQEPKALEVDVQQSDEIRAVLLSPETGEVLSASEVIHLR